MDLNLIKKVSKKSGYELEDVLPKIRNLTNELTEYVDDSFKLLREILIFISKIVHPFWFHIPDAVIEDARYEITAILTDINNFLHCHKEGKGITENWATYYIEDGIKEFRDVIRGRIRGIIVRVRGEWRNIKDESLKEKVFKDVNYVVYRLVGLLTDLQEGEKRLAKLFVKGL